MRHGEEKIYFNERMQEEDYLLVIVFKLVMQIFERADARDKCNNTTI